MRQFVTWGFWLSLLALVGLTYGLLTWVRGQDDDALASQLPADVTVPGLVPAEPDPTRIDLIAMVFAAQADPGFAIEDGVATKGMQIRVDGLRYMEIRPGTPGENRCPDLDELAKCAVAADLLGEAVLWFSIVPLSPRNTVELPAVAEIIGGGRARLANGWIVDHARVLKRVCSEDTVSLTDFIRRFGEDATSTYSLDEQRLVSVTCRPPSDT